METTNNHPLDQNIDHNEINKFDSLAHSWWDEEGPLKTLHQINPLRVKFITDNVNITNKKILDIGCGAGILSVKLAELQAKVTGIDLANNAINVAKLHVLDKFLNIETKKLNIDINFQNITLQQLCKEQKEKYHIITCMEMLEHVPNPAKIIENAAALLDEGGSIFLSTLNRNLKSYLTAIIGAEYLLNLLPINTHEYHKFIKPNELARILRDNNLEIIKQIGIEYNIFTNNFNLTDNIDVNYIIYAKKRSS